MPRVQPVGPALLVYGHPDAKPWVALAHGGRVRLFDPDTRLELASIELHTGEAPELAFVDAHGSLRLLVSDGRALTSLSVPELTPIARLEFDEPVVVSTVAGARVLLLDAQLRNPRLLAVAPAGLGVSALSLRTPVESSVETPEGTLLVWARGQFEVWDLLARRATLRVQLPLMGLGAGLPVRLGQMGFAARQRLLWIATGQAQGIVELFRWSDGRGQGRVAVGGRLLGVAGHLEGERVVVAVEVDGRPRLRALDATTREELALPEGLPRDFAAFGLIEAPTPQLLTVDAIGQVSWLELEESSLYATAMAERRARAPVKRLPEHESVMMTRANLEKLGARGSGAPSWRGKMAGRAAAQGAPRPTSPAETEAKTETEGQAPPEAAAPSPPPPSSHPPGEGADGALTPSELPAGRGDLLSARVEQQSAAARDDWRARLHGRPRAWAEPATRGGNPDRVKPQAPSPPAPLRPSPPPSMTPQGTAVLSPPATAQDPPHSVAPMKPAGEVESAGEPDDSSSLHSEGTSEPEWRTLLAERTLSLRGQEPATLEQLGGVEELFEGTQLGQVTETFELEAKGMLALALLYGAWLRGAAAVPTAGLSRALLAVADELGAWEEALGRGELGRAGLVKVRRGTIRLRDFVGRFLDELSLGATRTRTEPELAVGAPARVEGFPWQERHALAHSGALVEVELSLAPHALARSAARLTRRLARARLERALLAVQVTCDAESSEAVEAVITLLGNSPALVWIPPSRVAAWAKLPAYQSRAPEQPATDAQRLGADSVDP